jgi:hypothetical protein
MSHIGLRMAAVAGVGLLAVAGPAAVRAQAPVKLEARFPEGQTLRYQVRTSMNQQAKNLGMEMPSNLNRTVVRSEAIGKRRGDSGLPIAVKVESIRERQRLPAGLDVSYDSKEATAKVANPDLDFFKDLYRMEGRVAYTVVLDGRNKVKAVEGADALRAQVDKLDPRAADLLRSRLAADALGQEFEQIHALGALPDGPVKPGASWERTETLDRGAGLEMVLRKKYEYASTEKKGDKALDKITAKVLEAKYLQDADSSAPVKLTKAEVKVASSEGTILFDREAGRVVEARERVELSGNLTFSAQGQDQRVGFDLTIRTDVQLQPGSGSGGARGRALPGAGFGVTGRPIFYLPKLRSEAPAERPPRRITSIVGRMHVHESDRRLPGPVRRACRRPANGLPKRREK